MYAFTFEAPSSTAAAAQLIAQGGKLLAGGQSLLPSMRLRLANPEKIVDLNGITELAGIRREGNALVIGAMTRHMDVAASSEVKSAIPALADLAAHIGDRQVRARGTLGGSVANNDPAACYPSAVLGLGATVITNRREIAADDFFVGMYTTALDEGELITEVRFPIPQAARYEKFIQVASRFPLVAVFVARFADGVRVAVTGASESGVFRWTEAEQALASDFSPDAVRDLTMPPEGMIADLHGSAEYRAHLVGVITRRAVAAAG